MKQRPRIYYTESQKALMWERYMGRKMRDFVDLMAHCVVNIDSYNYYIGTSTDPRKSETSQGASGLPPAGGLGPKAR